MKSRKLQILKVFLAIVLVPGMSLLTTPVKAQGGDQILDGIGETGLIARYTFEANVKDWSRNNLHATIQGEGFEFVADELFNRVLAFPAGGQAFITIPGEAVAGEESLSMTGWIFLRSAAPDQVFFDFGKSARSHFMAVTSGPVNGAGFEARILYKSDEYLVKVPSLTPNQWCHVAVVLNAPERTLSIYINGSKAGESKNVAVELKHLFDAQAKNNKLVIGKSIEAEIARTDAKWHDFRIYRIPLTDEQIAVIHQNGLKKEGAASRREARRRPPQDANLPLFPDTIPQLYTAWLTGVPDIQVETTVGILPQLPRFVKGVYSGNFNGPEVRVLWPAPKDNSQVLSPGTYTLTGSVAGSTLKPRAIVTVRATAPAPTPGQTLEGFNLDRVTLNADLHQHKTKFIENRDKFLTGLANTNPDNFLYMFRNAFGQVQPAGAEPLKGWDSQETKLRGHATGHYLTALAQAYGSTVYDQALRENFGRKIDYMVNTLHELSRLSGEPKIPGGEHVSDPTLVPPGPGKSGYYSNLSETGIRTDYWNWGKGFISAYPPDQFIMLEKGASYGGDSTKIWAPYYTLHKIFAGLMDIYEITGNAKALDIVKGMGDWVYARLSKVPTETLISMWNRYIAGEYGGMNEAMARLYRITQEPRYLETAHMFDNIRVFFGDPQHSGGLAKNVDMFRGLHANQHIPQMMGAIEVYGSSRDPEYYHIAEHFWEMATGDYMYSIGGVAGARNPNNAECFTSEPATLYQNGFAAGGQNETCATYNMLKLTRSLFLYDQRAELMDYYERGLYNHILASVDEHTPANTYHVPLRPGSVKQFGNAEMDGFSCCNGTALESSTKLQNSIYFRSADNEVLYVNLFIPSTLNWAERNVRITQTTAYPKEDQTRLTLNGSGKFEIRVRVPHWATQGFFVEINGQSQTLQAQPGSYISLRRDWKNGDTIEVRMPFTFYLEPVMDQQNIASLFYGPVLLAAQEPEPLKEWRKITLPAHDIRKAISGDPQKLEFTIDGILFKPFFDTYGRHSVYFDVKLEK